jgi:hypothetical protein
MARIALLSLVLCFAGCRSTMNEFIAQHKNVREVIPGNIYSTSQLQGDSTTLKDGVAFTITGKDGWVEITLQEREQNSLRRARRRVDLNPGDVIIHAQTSSYVLLMSR